MASTLLSWGLSLPFCKVRGLNSVTLKERNSSLDTPRSCWQAGCSDTFPTPELRVLPLSSGQSDGLGVGLPPPTLLPSVGFCHRFRTFTITTLLCGRQATISRMGALVLKLHLHPLLFLFVRPALRLLEPLNPVNREPEGVLEPLASRSPKSLDS